MKDCQPHAVSQSFYGGPGNIAGACVNAAGPDTDVYLTGGFCRSNLTEKTSWFVNLTKVGNVRGYNPVGIIATPFDPAGFLGPSGTQRAPLPGMTYTVVGADMMVTVDVGVPVAVADVEGRPFLPDGYDAGLTMQLIPVGWSLGFGDFKSASKVTVGGS